MVGIGFCALCRIRIFADETEGEDYFKEDDGLLCADCKEEIEEEGLE